MSLLAPPFFVISDTHWFHKNIVKYCNRDLGHNEIMEKRWHETVGIDDTVLHLGDIVFTRDKAKQDRFFKDIAPYLPGNKFLILGNHDRDDWIDRYQAAGFTVIPPFGFEYKGYYVDFDHYPTLGLRNHRRIRVHGHIHNNTFHDEFTSNDLGGNINVSVEVIDYTPQPIIELLDAAIEA